MTYRLPSDYFNDCTHSPACHTKATFRQNNQTSIAFRDKIKSEFIRFTDVPCLTLEHIEQEVAVGRREAEWKCLDCNELYSSSLKSRYSLGTDCLNCAKKTISQRRLKTPTHKQLGTMFPLLAVKALNVVDSTRDPKTISFGSNQKLTWQCDCGVQFTSEANRITTRGRVLCKVCTLSGKSRFEYEVGFLFEELTNITVEFHHKKDKLPAVDLYLPYIDTAIQLDPYWSHKDRTESDERITQQANQVYSSQIRLRQYPLPLVSNSMSIEDDKFSPLLWATQLAGNLGLKTNTLSDSQVAATLVKADEKWTQGQLESVNHHSSYHKEFVENISHPNRKIEFLPAQSKDVCKWKCTYCNTTWEQTLERRNRRDTLGCYDCFIKLRRKERHVTVSLSSKAVHNMYPLLGKEYMQNLTHPERVFESLNVKDDDIILWECSFCNDQWESSMENRRNGLPGCKKCRNRIALPYQKSLEFAYPELADFFISVKGKDFLTARIVRPTSRDIGIWKCSTCKNQVDKSIMRAWSSYTTWGKLPRCSNCLN